MAYLQIRHNLAVWGPLLRVGAPVASGSIIFGSAQDTMIGRVAADHLHTPDSLTVQGTSSFEAAVKGNPIRTAAGSAITTDGDMGFDGSTFYAMIASTISYWTPDGTIAV